MPDNIIIKDRCFVVQEILPAIQETVTLVPFIDEDENVTFLRSPNLANQSNEIRQRETDYNSHTDLLTSNAHISKQLADTLVSQSSDSVLLNVDYSRYENFVIYGSADQQLKNFYNKLTLIESYKVTSASLHSTSGSSADIGLYDYKIRDLINNFSGYENYLYAESSSYVSGSVSLRTEELDNSWPKTNSTKPYILSHITSSEASAWYTNQIATASLYDRENSNSLIQNLPFHIVEDNNNKDFLTFIKMLGQFFDNIWLYDNKLTDIHTRENSLDKGLSKDLIYDIANSLGINLQNGKDLINLPRYALGLQATGSGYFTYSTTPEKDITKEIWKRLLNNIPYFLKTKGTVNSLKGIINCYGIPSTILRVREYGGPDLVGNEQSYRITRKFTKALNFFGLQHVVTPWTSNINSGRNPDTIEFRFKAATGSNQMLVEQHNGTYSNWYINLIDNGSSDNIGRVQFNLSGSNGYQTISSSAFPVFDDEFYSVMLKRETFEGTTLSSDTASADIDYKLYVKKYDSGRSKIYLSSAVSMSISGSMGLPSSSYNTAFSSSGNLYIGGYTSGEKFGSVDEYSSMMEFRLWNTPLSESKFDNHVSAPKSYNGNHPSASYTDLILRYSFDDNIDHSLDNDVRDTSADQSYIQSGSAIGYTTGSHYSSVEDENKMLVPNIGANREMSNKIRIEDNAIDGNELSLTVSREKSSQDFAPLDSNKLGIYFAPTDVINEDIIESMADLNFNEYIGDPRDQYELKYRGLGKIRNSYWQKYKSPNNFWDYLRLLTYYDQSIFKQLAQFVPARAHTTYGTVIEPTILERPKVVFSRVPVAENLYHSGKINVSATNADMYVSLTSSYDYYTGDIENLEFRYPSLYQSVGTATNEWGLIYATASSAFGGLDHVVSIFRPITGSRKSEHNYITNVFYTSSADAYTFNYYSSSIEKAEYDTKYQEHLSFYNTFYAGCKQTKLTTISINKRNTKDLPFERITITNPRLVVQEPGESLLKIE